MTRILLTLWITGWALVFWSLAVLTCYGYLRAIGYLRRRFGL